MTKVEKVDLHTQNIKAMKAQYECAYDEGRFERCEMLEIMINAENDELHALLTEATEKAFKA